MRVEGCGAWGGWGRGEIRALAALYLGFRVQGGTEDSQRGMRVNVRAGALQLFEFRKTYGSVVTTVVPSLF